MLSPAVFEEYPISLEHTEFRGREFFAKQNIAKGDLVIAASVYATGIFDSHKKKVCTTCLKWQNAHGSWLTRCSKCDKTFYCSLECRRLDRLAGHRKICLGLRKLAALKINQHEYGVLKLVLKVLMFADVEGEEKGDDDGEGDCEHGVPDQDVTSVISGPMDVLGCDPGITDGSLNEEVNTAKVNGADQTKLSPLPVSDTDAIDSSLNEELDVPEETETLITTPLPFPTYDELVALESHASNWATEEEQSYKKGIRFVKQFVETSALTRKVDETEIKNLVSRIETNGFGVWNHNGSCYGRAIAPHLSYFNHSCDPNCDVKGGSIMTVTANRDIVEGEPLTITYIETNAPVSARRAKLLEDYHFTCGCPRCETEAQLPQQKISYQSKAGGKKPGHRKKQVVPKVLEA
ncbi:hypothetical protein SmJEL517_g03512 [Synchytrium microbalum]|uniref:SET domain-containing protein n=1 Tax=Synchytrium microbalum TaxID=1806994 RepID=A0A507C7Y1_9FUNG|nr:uncharacterized protein SmJEL517_g03512 [Synchytrium microbalum]TPX33633.1 hypothetical protein SmJEL517_g03512 [Synchytrium microbalum]